MSKYHDKYKCEQCEGVNEITVTSRTEGIIEECEGVNEITVTSSTKGIIEECETKCTKCDHEDYWAYGYYDRGC